MSDTLNPLGTFGTGYDVGTFGQSPTLDEPSGGGGSKSGSSSSGGIGGGSIPPPGTLSVPDAIPQFSYTLKASRRVDFTNNSLNAVRYKWIFYASSYIGSSIIGSSIQENPIFFYPYAGGIKTYAVALRAYNADGDYVETSIQVVVEDLVPDCDFIYVVSGTIVRFFDTSTNIDATTNSWAFGDFEWSTETNPHHTYPGNGTYLVTLTRGTFSRTQFVVIDAEIILTCDPASGATGYKWERSANGVDGWVEFADTADATVDVTEASHGINSTVVNYFRVKAYDGSGESAYSNITNVRCG